MSGKINSKTTLEKKSKTRLQILVQYHHHKPLTSFSYVEPTEIHFNLQKYVYLEMNGSHCCFNTA